MALAAEAQPAGKLYRLGWLGARSPNSAPHLSAATIHALRELGWVEAQNLVIDYRWAEGRSDRLPALAADLLRGKPDVIYISREIAGKRIERLKENLPRLGRLAVIYNPDDPGKAVEWAETEAAGRTLGLKMAADRIRDPKRVREGAFAATRRGSNS